MSGHMEIIDLLLEEAQRREKISDMLDTGVIKQDWKNTAILMRDAAKIVDCAYLLTQNHINANG